MKYKVRKPRESPEDRLNALNASLCTDLEAIRRKYRLPMLLWILTTPIEGDRSLSRWAQFLAGDPSQAEVACAWAFGQLQVQRQRRVHALMQGAVVDRSER